VSDESVYVDQYGRMWFVGAPISTSRYGRVEFVGGPWDGEVETFSDASNVFVTRAGWEYMFDGARMVLLGQAYALTPRVPLLWRIALWLNHPSTMWRAARAGGEG